MKPLTLYILRHEPTDLPEALFSPNDSPSQVCVVSRLQSDGSESGESGSLIVSVERFTSDRRDPVSYDNMLEMVLEAKKILVL